MKRRSLVPLALVLLALSIPTASEAQVGAVIDWINKLSGPGLIRVGPEVTLDLFDDESNRVALAPLFAVHVDDHDNPETEQADIGAFSVQGTLDSKLLDLGDSAELRSRFGFEVHRFWGEFDSFWAPSFPFLVALRVPANDLAFRLGTGFNVFSFPDDAFAPFDVGVETDGFDAGWTVQLGVEYDLNGFALFD